jgi:multiple sugar transport system substrate-binding protein
MKAKKQLFKLKCLLLLSILLLLVNSCAMATTTLTLLGKFSNWGDSFAQAINNFEQKHDVKIEVMDYGDWRVIREKVATMATGGVYVDVFFADNRTVGYYAFNDLAEPLDALAARDIKLDRYPQVTLNPMRYNGKLYALPVTAGLFNVYYNPSLFQKAGLPAPVSDWTSKKWTWDDFVNSARKMTVDTNGDGIPDRYGIQSFGTKGGHNHIGAWGVWFIDNEKPIYYGDRPEVISAYEKTTSLWTVHQVIGGNFINGTAAMNVVQTGSLNNLVNNRGMVEWLVAAMPLGTQRATQTGFGGIAVAKGSKNLELAWELAKYLAYDTEGTTLISRAANRLPVLRETTRDFMNRFQKILPESSVLSLVDAIAYAYDQRFSRFAYGDEVAQLIVAAGARVIKGEVSVREALTSIAPEAKALLEAK